MSTDADEVKALREELAKLREEVATLRAQIASTPPIYYAPVPPPRPWVEWELRSTIEFRPTPAIRFTT